MKKIYILSLLIALALFCCSCSSGPQYDYGSAETKDQEVSYPEDEDLYFGYGEVFAPAGGSDVLVEYAEPLDCTKEALASWYKQDVQGAGYAYALIIYTGVDCRGVYASPEGVIQTDVVIEDGSFVDSTDKTIVYVYKNGKLE